MRGLVAVAFGVLALAWPRLTLAVLVLGFACYAITDGIFTLAAAGGDRERTWLTVLEGVLSIVAGLLVLFMPSAAARLAYFCIGAWALVTGVMQLLEAPRLRREVSGGFVLGISGVLRVLLGVVLLARPHSGLTRLLLLLALYAYLEGMLMLGLAIVGKPRQPLPA